jgi:hypothetical protein
MPAQLCGAARNIDPFRAHRTHESMNLHSLRTCLAIWPAPRHNLPMAGREYYHCKQWIAEGQEHDCWTTTEAASPRICRKISGTRGNGCARRLSLLAISGFTPSINRSCPRANPVTSLCARKERPVRYQEAPLRAARKEYTVIHSQFRSLSHLRGLASINACGPY